MKQKNFLRTFVFVAMLLRTVAASAQFPAGETRYYTSEDGIAPIWLTFYYDNGDRCFKFYNPRFSGGIPFMLFGMKNGLSEYGQYQEQSRIGPGYTVYKEKVRSYLFSFAESLLFSPDFSQFTLKGAYNSSSTMHAISKQQFDRIYAKFKQSERSGSGSMPSLPSTGNTRPEQRHARTVRVTCVICKGTSRCISCHGSGYLNSDMRCTLCHATGQCSSCRGLGYTTKVVYD